MPVPARARQSARREPDGRADAVDGGQPERASAAVGEHPQHHLAARGAGVEARQRRARDLVERPQVVGALRAGDGGGAVAGRAVGDRLAEREVARQRPDGEGGDQGGRGERHAERGQEPTARVPSQARDGQSEDRTHAAPAPACRARCARTLLRLPQMRIEHQMPVRLREWS